MKLVDLGIQLGGRASLVLKTLLGILVFSSPTAPLEMFGDIFYCFDCRGNTTFQWVEVSEIVKQNTVYSQPHTTKNFLVQKGNRAEAKKPYSRLLQTPLDHCRDLLLLSQSLSSSALRNSQHYSILPKALLQSECPLYVYQGEKPNVDLWILIPEVKRPLQYS